MNFNRFDNIKFDEKEKLLNMCYKAESHILTDPFVAVTSSRTALEHLCTGLLKQKNIPLTPDTKLFEKIHYCEKYGLTKKIKKEADVVRKGGNVVIHGVTDANIAKAKKIVQNLYKVMQAAFKEVTAQFDEQKIPINEYEIVRTVSKGKHEAVIGSYNYFVKDARGKYFYIQPYGKDVADEQNRKRGERTADVHQHLTEDRRRRKYMLDTDIIETPSNSDRYYIVYQPVYEESFLLSEFKGKMTPEQAIYMAIDILEVLLEMKKVGDGMHHRNIQPGCVIATPYEGKYQAALVNLEMVKIEASKLTVWAGAEGNVYLPREVNVYIKGTQFDYWEQVDVYSTAMTMLYCLDPNMVGENVDVDSLYDVLPDEVVDALSTIFGSSLAQSLRLEEFKEVLEKSV